MVKVSCMKCTYVFTNSIKESHKSLSIGSLILELKALQGVTHLSMLFSVPQIPLLQLLAYVRASMGFLRKEGTPYSLRKLLIEGMACQLPSR